MSAWTLATQEMGLCRQLLQELDMFLVQGCAQKTWNSLVVSEAQGNFAKQEKFPCNN